MQNITERAKKIKVILNDVDGIWTDGKLHFYVTPEGKIEEIKSFNALDGIAVMLCRLAGLKCGVITGRRHETTVARARNLGMSFFYQGFLTKALALEDILKRGGNFTQSALFPNRAAADAAFSPNSSQNSSSPETSQST